MKVTTDDGKGAKKKEGEDLLSRYLTTAVAISHAALCPLFPFSLFPSSPPVAGAATARSVERVKPQGVLGWGRRIGKLCPKNARNERVEIEAAMKTKKETKVYGSEGHCGNGGQCGGRGRGEKARGGEMEGKERLDPRR